MSAEVFVDTNLLYYALTQTPDPRHALARECIRRLWETGRAAFSVQCSTDWPPPDTTIPTPNSHAALS